MKRRTFLTSVAALPLSFGFASLARAGGALAVLLPPWGTLPKAMTDKYTADTGLTLDIQTLGWDEIHTKIATSMVAGTPPASATEMDWSWAGQFGAAGWYDDLTGIVPADVIADVPTAAIFTYDGEPIGIPYNNDFRVTSYTKAHLDAAGVMAPPKTIDERLAAAQAAVAEPLFAQGTAGWYSEFSSAVQTGLNAAAKGQITVADAMKQIADAAATAQQ